MKVKLLLNTLLLGAVASALHPRVTGSVEQQDTGDQAGIAAIGTPSPLPSFSLNVGEQSSASLTSSINLESFPFIGPDGDDTLATSYTDLESFPLLTPAAETAPSVTYTDLENFPAVTQGDESFPTATPSSAARISLPKGVDRQSLWSYLARMKDVVKSFAENPSLQVARSTPEETKVGGYDGTSGEHSYEPMYSLNKRYSTNIKNALGASKGQCTAKNAYTRRSWSRLSEPEKFAFRNALECLHHTLNNTFKDPYSKIHTVALRHRIDDFTIVHSEWSYLDLFSGTYLHWHRWLLYFYEKALKDECGYEGSLPYWDFSEHSDDITMDPIFSGQNYSLGTNGLKVPHGRVRVNWFDQKFIVNPGNGGGCIEELDFTKVALGLPLKYNKDFTQITDHPWPEFDATGYIRVWWDNGYDYLERCIKRDLNSLTGSMLNISRIERDLACSDFKCFLTRLNGLSTGRDFGALNLVNTVRFAVGGLQIDPLTAPNDPIFWLIQANIDRLWAVWQGQDLKNRVNQVTGKHNPWSRDSDQPYHGWNVTLDEELTIGPIDPAWIRHTGDLKSTIEGPLFCYDYDSQ